MSSDTFPERSASWSPSSALLGDDTQIIDSIDRVTADWAAAIRDIIEILRRTDSFKVRNTAAIALVDMNAKAACDSIIDVLRRPEIGPQAGTLLFALDELGASLPLDVAVGLIEHGSYEARAETVMFLRDGRIGDFDNAMRIAATQKLSRFAAMQNEEISAVATIALETIGRRRAD